MPDLPGTGGFEAPVRKERAIAVVSELNLILVGPPGAGKGTQAERLTEDFGLPYYATGNILRDAVAEGTPLGKKAKEYMDKGDLVPDDVIIGVILEALKSDAAADGFLLDGFPRTVPQADALADELERRSRRLTAAMLVEAQDEVVVKRLSGRRQCSKNHLYHVDFDPPKHEGVCDQCGRPLTRRDDDDPDKVRTRLAIYHQDTEPLIDYYDELGLLRRFDGTRTPGEVHDHVRATLATLRLEERL
jgi:adenylate kinase